MTNNIEQRIRALEVGLELMGEEWTAIGRSLARIEQISRNPDVSWLGPIRPALRLIHPLFLGLGSAIAKAANAKYRLGEEQSAVVDDLCKRYRLYPGD